MGPKVGQGSARKSHAGISATLLLVPCCLFLPLHRVTGDSTGSLEPKETRGRKESG